MLWCRALNGCLGGLCWKNVQSTDFSILQFLLNIVCDEEAVWLRSYLCYFGGQPFAIACLTRVPPGVCVGEAVLWHVCNYHRCFWCISDWLAIDG